MDAVHHAAHQMDPQPAGTALFERQREIGIGGGCRVEGTAIVDDLSGGGSGRDGKPNPDRIRRRQALEGVSDHVDDSLLEAERQLERDVVGKPLRGAADPDPLDQPRDLAYDRLHGEFVRGHGASYRAYGGKPSATLSPPTTSIASAIRAV